MANYTKNTLGKIVKKVAGGAINRTLSRLKGARVPVDSKLTFAQASWSGRDSRKDWRVRLTIPEGSHLENYFFENNQIMEPLYDLKGIFWPLTPSMVIQHSAAYNPLSQTHSNYPFQAYQNSQVDQINIVGEYPVQNYQDAKHWVATVKFLRTITKMFFGQEDEFKGNPPPILHMSGYGTHMFEKVPVVVNTFNVELRSGIDYISTNPEVTDQLTTDFQTLDPSEIEATWAPTLSLISVLVTPVYSRQTLKNFSLKDFSNGTLSKNEGIGFI